MNFTPNQSLHVTSSQRAVDGILAVLNCRWYEDSQWCQSGCFLLLIEHRACRMLG